MRYNFCTSLNWLKSGFAADFGMVQRKLLQNFRGPTEIVFQQRPRFFDDLRYFQKQKLRLKMIHEAEGLQFQKAMKTSIESLIFAFR